VTRGATARLVWVADYHNLQGSALANASHEDIAAFDRSHHRLLSDRSSVRLGNHRGRHIKGNSIGGACLHLADGYGPKQKILFLTHFRGGCAEEAFPNSQSQADKSQLM
jgi:hypothetical protein